MCLGGTLWINSIKPSWVANQLDSDKPDEADHFYIFFSQVAEMKKKVEHEAQTLESVEEGKKKLQREVENFMQQLEERNASFDKLDKTKTRLQRELDDVLVDQAHLRQTVQELERKQKKFDQVEDFLTMNGASMHIFNSFQMLRFIWSGSNEPPTHGDS